MWQSVRGHDDGHPRAKIADRALKNLAFLEMAMEKSKDGRTLFFFWLAQSAI